MEPRIQYAKTSDGVSIAYWTLGEGPPLVLPPGLISSHLQMEWDLPVRRAQYECMAEGATVVRYDPRGVGMSESGAIDFSLEAESRDLEAVLHALGIERFALYSRPASGDLPFAYAAQHSERVSHLVVGRATRLAGLASMRSITRSFLPLADEEWETFTNIYSRLVFGWDSPDATPTARLIRACHSPQTFRAAHDATLSYDPLTFAVHVRVPTLILHPLGDEHEAAGARNLAAAIAGAQVAGIPGDAWVGFPSTAGIAAIHDFITSPVGKRMAAADLDTSAFRSILFTDIVAHTAMMERLGDEAGRNVLREHERITREALRAHSGSEIKTIGDSFMASFASAKKAVECAIALQRSFASAEVCGEQVRIRAGINAGEPITESDDLFGASVILAARSKEAAGAGEIVVTDVVRQLVTGKGFLFAERGSVALRGFEEPVRLYEVRWREET